MLDGLRINDAQTASRYRYTHSDGSHLAHRGAAWSRLNVLRLGCHGGAVNFVTSPARATELRVRAGGGNQGFNQEHIFASLLLHQWSETIAADRDFSTGFIPDRDYRSSSASSETRLQSDLGQTDVIFAGSDRPSVPTSSMATSLRGNARRRGLPPRNRISASAPPPHSDTADTPTSSSCFATIPLITRTTISTKAGRLPCAARFALRQLRSLVRC